MNDTNQNASNDQDLQNLNDQVSVLLDKAKKVGDRIEETNKMANSSIDVIEKDVDEAIGKVEQIYSDLDKADEETSAELDKLVLDQAEDLATSDSEDTE